MGWPYDKYLWRDNALPAKRQYAAVAKTISQFEPVTMWADPSVADEAKQYLADAPNVTVQVRDCVWKGEGWGRCWQAYQYGPSVAMTRAQRRCAPDIAVGWGRALAVRMAGGACL
jgi:agmatine/peptidylarginine deiminase